MKPRQDENDQKCVMNGFGAFHIDKKRIHLPRIFDKKRAQ